MPSPRKLPGDLSLRSFTLRESQALGVTERRTRSSAFVTPSRGIRVPWGADQELADILRPLCDSTPLAAISFGSAARLWGIPLPYMFQQELTVHVTRPRAATAPRRKGVTGHKMSLLPEEVTEISGVKVTTPARTWLDLARILELDALVAAGDAVVNAQHRSFHAPRAALASIADLQRIVRHHPRSRGLVNARFALDLIRVGADSPPETRLRLAMVRAGLPEPTLRYVIVDETMDDVAWPDHAFPEYRVAVQYDGAHHFTRDQAEKDIVRNERVAAAGWTQVIITSRMIEAFGEDGVVAKVRNALLRNGWTRPPALSA